MTLVAIAGLGGSLAISNLPYQQYFAATFAILALGCVYFTKDALDREKQLNNLATDRLLVQAQLRNTESRLETTQQNLVRIERELEEERMKIETAVGNLGGQVKDLGTENTRFKDNNDRLDGTVTRLQEILEHKS
jgi:septal ring factor EnvC (AmiA/AmiB activator)